MSRQGQVFFKDPLTWVDILAILPFYIQLIADSSAIKLTWVRVIRLARIFRIFKLGKYAEGFKVILKALIRSREALFMLVFFLILAIIFFSSLIFYAEQSDNATFNQKMGLWYYEDGTVSPFTSIFHSAWWCIVTVTTVGYGDMYPITGAGKVVAAFTMICGILVLAFPMTILGASIGEVYSEQQKIKQFLSFHSLHMDLTPIRRIETLEEACTKMDDTILEVEKALLHFKSKRDTMKFMMEQIKNHVLEDAAEKEAATSVLL